MATQAWQLQVIEQMNLLWNTLPLKSATDPRATLEAYGFALEGNSIEAIRNVINALRRGEIAEASKTFCPRAPELADMVRAEQRKIDATNRRPAISSRPIERPWTDYRARQRQETYDLMPRGYELHSTGVSQETWHRKCLQRAWPIGAKYKWALEEVWSPIGAQMPSNGIVSVLKSAEEAA